MKKMYFLKDRKEAVIDRLTYMSKHRQEYLQDKEHGMITLLFRQSIWLGLAWFCALLLLEVLPFYALESCVTFRHVKMFVTHYLADYIGESEEIYEM